MTVSSNNPATNSNVVEFFAKYPKVSDYINRLKEMYKVDGVDGFHDHHLIISGGSEEDRVKTIRSVSVFLQEYMIRGLPSDIGVSRKFVDCAGRDILEMDKQVFSDIRKDLKGKDGSIQKFVSIIEILTLQNIYGELESLLNKLATILDISYCNPEDYKIGLVISTLKQGEKFDSLPTLFTNMCEYIDLSVEVEPMEEQAGNYEFVLNGEYWKITYEGKTINLKNTIGLQYIHYLLENPNKDLTPSKLVGEISKVKPDAYRKSGKPQERQSTEDGSVKKRPDGTPFGQVLTDEARKESMKRYNKLKSDLEDDREIKCDEEVVEIEKEMKQIMKSLKASINKDGKSRNFADITERDRRSVSKAIDESLDKIKDKKNGILALWIHFDRTLKSGTSCFYKPEKPIPWNL